MIKKRPDMVASVPLNYSPLYSLRQLADMLGKGYTESKVKKLLDERGIQYLRSSGAVPVNSVQDLIRKLQQEKKNPKLKEQHIMFARTESKLKNVK